MSSVLLSLARGSRRVWRWLLCGTRRRALVSMFGFAREMNSSAKESFCLFLSLGHFHLELVLFLLQNPDK